jgi:hypothetical protein
MSRFSRRSFLTRSSLVVAAGGVAATVPGLGAMLQAAPAEAPEIEGAASEGEAAAADLSGPLVAHVTDIRSGDISFYEGERQVIYRDPGLAARLYRASR